jgi:hypothetical protein
MSNLGLDHPIQVGSVQSTGAIKAACVQLVALAVRCTQRQQWMDAVRLGVACAATPAWIDEEVEPMDVIESLPRLW